jgi:hypothetical protein
MITTPVRHLSAAGDGCSLFVCADATALASSRRQPVDCSGGAEMTRVEVPAG